VTTDKTRRSVIAEIPRCRVGQLWPKDPLPSARQHPSYGDCLEV